MNKYQKGFAPIVIALIVLVLAGVGGASYYLIAKQSPKQTACTTEAMLCPDGSSVGRTGPNCEFAACPEVKADEMANWPVYENDKYGFEVKYPSNYVLFQGTVQTKEKVIPADLNSQKIFITDRPEMFFCCEPDYVSIEILDTYIFDLEKYLTDQKIINSDNTYRIKNKGYITFNGEQAYQVQSESGIDSPGNIILVNHNSKTYYIKDVGLSLSDKIISTFKFSKETKADGTISNQDFLLNIIGNNLEIKDKKTGSLVQTIPFSDEKCFSTDYWKSQAISFTNDINFDGHKDLRLCDGLDMKDLWSYYWIYNPITKKFEKNEELGTLSGQHKFDPTKKEISDTYYLGCAGSCYGGKTLSFVDGKYLLTYKWEISYDSSKEQFIKITKELKNGKWEIKEAPYTQPIF